MNEYFIGAIGSDILSINESKVAFKNSECQKEILVDEDGFQLVGISDESIKSLRIYDSEENVLIFKTENHIKRAQIDVWKGVVLNTILNNGVLGDCVNSFQESVLLMVFDKSRETISIFNDRFGLFPIYYLQTKNGIYFANDTKPFLGLNDLDIVISQDACRSFIYSGQLVGNLSWFEGVKYLQASTNLHYNNKNNDLKQSVYWSWNKVKRVAFSFEESVQRVNNELEKAVNDRIKGDNNSLFLSGGRDSSIILLSQKSNFIKSAYIYTDKENQRSIKTAVELSAAFNTDLLKLTRNENKYNLLLEGLWNCSCEVSELHLHLVPFLNKFRVSDIFHNGIPGDLNLGGTYMLNHQSRVNRKQAVQHPNHNCSYLPEYLDFVNSSFFDYEGTDPFYFDTRVKRFTLRGMESLGIKNQSAPFMDLRLNDLLYSLDPKFRQNRKLYDQILKNYEFSKYSKRNLLKSGISYTRNYFRKESRQNPDPLQYGNVLEFINKKDIVINEKIPNIFTQKRLSSIDSWIKMIYE